MSSDKIRLDVERPREAAVAAALSLRN